MYELKEYLLIIEIHSVYYKQLLQREWIKQ